jgi:hypothetical protein
MSGKRQYSAFEDKRRMWLTTGGARSALKYATRELMSGKRQNTVHIAYKRRMWLMTGGDRWHAQCLEVRNKGVDVREEAILCI